MSTIDQVQPLSATPAKPRTRASARQVLTTTLKYVILLTLTATWVFPFYWMFTSAIKDDNQIYTIPPVLVPIPAHWNNFVDAWTHNNFTLYAFNSIVYYCRRSWWPTASRG